MVPGGRFDCDTLTRRYRSGETDPVATAEQCLARAQSPEARGVFITLTPERARTEAQASAARYRQGRPLGPLDGVPVAWKDVFDLTGTRTSAGSPTRRTIRPADRDAPCVANLAAAGMVCVGKTNLSELAFSGLGLNAAYGTPPNARNQEAIPGGSSSGSATAVALGIVPCAIGTDTSGSVRIPAAFQGLAGFRPSAGRFSDDGVFPLSPTLDTVGPLAHRVADVIALDRALRGVAAHDLGPPAANAEERTLIVPEGELVEGATPAVRDRFDEVLSRLESAGWRIRRRQVRPLDSAQALMDSAGTLVAAEAARTHADLLRSPAAEQVDPRIRRRLEAGAALAPATLSRLLAERRKLMAALEREVDSPIVFPTVRMDAPALADVESDDGYFAEVNAAILRSTMVTSFLGMTSLALPFRSERDEYPASVSMSLPAGQDERLLRLALAAEAT